MADAAQILDWSVAIVLVAGGVVGWRLGLRRLAILAVLAAGCWPGARLFHAAAPLAAAGLVTSAVWTPVAVVLLLEAAGARMRRSSVVVLGALVTSITGLGIARAAVYEPFLDPRCRIWCGHSPMLVHADIGLARQLVVATSVLSLVAFVAAALIVAADASRRPRASRPVSVSAAAAGAVLGTSAAITAVRRPEVMPEFVPSSLVGWRTATGLALATALAVAVADKAMMWFRLRTVGRVLTGGVPARQQLAVALGDRALTVGHWVDGTGFVDPTGVPLGPADVGRRRTELTSRGAPIAVVDHRADVGEHLLERHLGPRVRTAIQNENLELQLHRDVEELSASRRRVIEVADSERVRLERDLHDGAQQRVLALSFELRRGRRQAEASGNAAAVALYDDASQATLRLLERLREVAHGIYPAVLAGAGFAPALHSLADSATPPLTVAAAVLARPPGDVERAAYSIIRDMMPGAASGVVVDADERQVSMRFTGVVVPVESALDRIAAARGRHAFRDEHWEVVLPCE